MLWGHIVHCDMDSHFLTHLQPTHRNQGNQTHCHNQHFQPLPVQTHLISPFIISPTSFFIFFDNSIVEGGRFEPWMTLLETPGGANQ